MMILSIPLSLKNSPYNRKEQLFLVQLVPFLRVALLRNEFGEEC